MADLIRIAGTVIRGRSEGGRPVVRGDLDLDLDVDGNDLKMLRA
ncbi:MAG: hypothetical protein R3F43_21650 [bacterium]